MRAEQLVVFLVLATSSSTLGRHVREQEQSFTQNAVDKNGFEDRGEVFEDGKNSIAQHSRVRLLREDDDHLEELREQEGYLKFNGRSLDTSTDKDNMVEKALDEGSPELASNKGWSLPSIGTVTGWATTAYSKLPTYQTVASYVPEPLQQYMPSQETVDSYKPSVESIKAQLQAPLDFLKWRMFGNYKMQKLLTEEERSRVIQALKAKILHKEGGENIPALVNELAEKVANRAEDNLTPVVIRVIVHKMVYAMAISYIGPLGAYLMRVQIETLANTISNTAITQYLKAGPNSRLDVYTYLKKIDWRPVLNQVVALLKPYTD